MTGACIQYVPLMTIRFVNSLVSFMPGKSLLHNTASPSNFGRFLSLFMKFWSIIPLSRSAVNRSCSTEEVNCNAGTLLENPGRSFRSSSLAGKPSGSTAGSGAGSGSSSVESEELDGGMIDELDDEASNSSSE